MIDDLLKNLLDDFDHGLHIIRTGYLWAEEYPQAKQSTRFGKGRAFTSAKKRQYLKRLAAEFKASHPSGVVLRGKIRLTILFCFPFTQAEGAMAKLGWALTDKHVDLDNLLKPVKDSMKNIVMIDDHQVVEVRARKIRYKTGCIAVQVDEVRVRRDT